MHAPPVPRFLVMILAVFLFSAPGALCQDVKSVPGKVSPPGPRLLRAIMCEGIKDGDPHNPGIVFSVAIGRVLCFSDFDAITKRTVLYHNWYFRDRLATRLKLSLQPPRWAVYSSIQLREADRGPWRVEITDQEGYLFETLRFSITD